MTRHVVMEPDIALVPLPMAWPAWRRRVIVKCRKWDPQVGDCATISDHACIISESLAAQLKTTAEMLAAETLALEAALMERPDLQRVLGLNATLRGALKGAGGPTVRVMRFDLHPTDAGFALSEVNSDVPGGFAESGALARMAAELIPGARADGDAAVSFAKALAGRLPAGGRVALVHCTSYADDRQVMVYLKERFAEEGLDAFLCAPDHLRWQDGAANCLAQDMQGVVDGVVRFFPADWLTALPRRSGWRGYFQNRIVSANPPLALLSQAKRHPLVWDRLGLALPAWRALLPETRDPRHAPWARDENWLIKPAFGRIGGGVAWFGGVSKEDWRHSAWRARLYPRQWLAQRRFASRPLMSAKGLRHLCLGVFVIDGKAAGFYARLARHRHVDQQAEDIAVLVREVGR